MLFLQSWKNQYYFESDFLAKNKNHESVKLEMKKDVDLPLIYLDTHG